MVDIRIMASPKREAYVKDILKKLNMNDDIVVWDDRPNGGDAMYTAMKAWTYPLPNGCTHRLVLQDDIDISNNFTSHINAIAKRHPTHIVSLINFLNPTNYPNKRGTPYYKVNNMAGCAIMMPVQFIKPCMDWCKNSDNEILKPHDDLMISEYCRTHNIMMVSILPCIVQHLNIDTLLGKTYDWERVCKNFEKNPKVNWDIHSVQRIR
jgi:hypothetical protein